MASSVSVQPKDTLIQQSFRIFAHLFVHNLSGRDKKIGLQGLKKFKGWRSKRNLPWVTQGMPCKRSVKGNL